MCAGRRRPESVSAGMPSGSWPTAGQLRRLPRRWIETCAPLLTGRSTSNSVARRVWLSSSQAVTPRRPQSGATGRTEGDGAGHPQCGCYGMGHLELEGGASVLAGALWPAAQQPHVLELPASAGFRRQTAQESDTEGADATKRDVLVATYVALRQEAQTQGAEIFFVDEAHFRADVELQAKWGLWGEPALVDSTSPKLDERPPIARRSVWDIFTSITAP